MKSPKLVNGDFQIGPGGYLMVEGSQKVIQDLGAIVREPYGQDRFHPRWGTILEDYIGRAIGKESSALIRSEIQRLIQNYIVVQNQQMEKDAQAGRKPRYKPSEIVSAVSGIAVQQAYDRINVKVSVETQNGESFDILRSVSV